MCHSLQVSTLFLRPNPCSHSMLCIVLPHVYQSSFLTVVQIHCFDFETLAVKNNVFTIHCIGEIFVQIFYVMVSVPDRLNTM